MGVQQKGIEVKTLRRGIQLLSNLIHQLVDVYPDHGEWSPRGIKDPSAPTSWPLAVNLRVADELLEKVMWQSWPE